MIFRDKVKSSPVRLNISSTSTTTTYINVDASRRKITALRGGLSNYRSSFISDEGDMIIGNGDTLCYSGIIDSTGLHYIFDGNGWASMVNSHSLYFGLSFQNIINMAAYVEGYGTRKTNKSCNFYFDVMLNYHNGFKEIEYSGNVYDTKESTKTKPLGWRVGYEWLFIGKFTWGFKTELGIRPGFKEFYRNEPSEKGLINNKNFFFNLHCFLPVSWFNIGNLSK